jgi:glycosyltransferase involved in cell wall biosynthesis
LVFAGNPYLQEGINELEDGKRIAKELKISDNVKWLGWVSGEEKEKTFNEASIYCLASEGEGFPMGVLDAWAYGLPCVMTPVGGINDIVQDGINGLLFPIGDYNTLAQKLDELMSDSQLRNCIVEQTDNLVLDRFSIDNINKNLDHIYSSLLPKQDII